MFVQQNHAAGRANGSIMVVVFVSSVFQVFRKAFRAGVFFPSRMDLVVKLLTAYQLW